MHLDLVVAVPRPRASSPPATRAASAFPVSDAVRESFLLTAAPIAVAQHGHRSWSVRTTQAHGARHNDLKHLFRGHLAPSHYLRLGPPDVHRSATLPGALRLQEAAPLSQPSIALAQARPRCHADHAAARPNGLR